jgi:hypothetical protein
MAPNNRGNAIIYDGSETFNGEQMGRMLGVKIPPFATCRVEERDRRYIIHQREYWVPLNRRILREHNLAFGLNGHTFEAPTVTSWWIPYDLNEIMRFGNSLNLSIPVDQNEAGFPEFPWPERMIIRVKLAATPKKPKAALINNNNTFTWSGPSGVGGYTGQAPERATHHAM